MPIRPSTATRCRASLAQSYLGPQRHSARMVVFARHVHDVRSTMLAAPELRHENFTCRPSSLQLFTRRRSSIAHASRRQQGHEVHEAHTRLPQARGYLAHVLVVDAGYEHRIHFHGQASDKCVPDAGPLVLDQDLGGLAVPTTLRAGWWPGTDRWVEGEFFRATIDRFEPL